MDEYVRNKEKEISSTQARLEQLKKDYEPYKAQDDLNLLFDIFPKASERLYVIQLCKDVGLTKEATQALFNGKLQLSKEQGDTYKLRLNLNGQNIIDWFKEQFGKLRQAVRPHIKFAEPTQKKGRGI